MTLVELMVALAVAVVIFTLISRIYVRYTAKTAVMSVMGLTMPLQMGVGDYYTDNGFMPGTSDYTTSLTNPTADVASIAYVGPQANCTSGTAACTNAGANETRQIEVTFATTPTVASNLLGGKKFILRANLNGGVVQWVCRTHPSSSPLDSTLLPVSCQG